MKILINVSPGGFGLADLVLNQMYTAGVIGVVDISKTNQNDYWLDVLVFDRSDSVAIDIVERVGLEAAAGLYCTLKIVTIPDDVQKWEVYTSELGMERILYGDYEWSNGCE